jgi:hypothetical protein
MLSEEL